jgi:hypothetical protein
VVLADAAVFHPADSRLAFVAVVVVIAATGSAVGVPATASAVVPSLGLLVFLLAAAFTGWPSAAGTVGGGVTVGWAGAAVVVVVAATGSAVGVPATASAVVPSLGLLVFLLAAAFTGWPSAVGRRHRRRWGHRRLGRCCRGGRCSDDGVRGRCLPRLGGLGRRRRCRRRPGRGSVVVATVGDCRSVLCGDF